MSVTFRPAKRENVGLWINLIGGTGSGKTFSGMRLASGIAGDKPFAVIDTENRRALHYADQFKFDHAELAAPFLPETYVDAIVAADEANYPVIMLDSGSHVWAGDGGVLDWHEQELNRMAGDDWKKRDACNMAAWIRPKMSHKKMVSKLLQIKAHLILCLRAEPKVEMMKDGSGKWAVQPKQSLTGLDGWIPVCEKNLPFEATVSFLFMADKPGVPHPIKLQEQHKAIFPLGSPVTEQAGKRLAQWAKGNVDAITEADFKNCATQEELGKLWTELSPADKKRFTVVKDEMKAKLTQPVTTERRDHQDAIEEERRKPMAPTDPMKEALSFIKAGDFDMARTMKQYLPEADQKFIEEEIAVRLGGK